jgi:hypothetical protein
MELGCHGVKNYRDRLLGAGNGQHDE